MKSMHLTESSKRSGVPWMEYYHTGKTTSVMQYSTSFDKVLIPTRKLSNAPNKFVSTTLDITPCTESGLTDRVQWQATWKGVRISTTMTFRATYTLWVGTNPQQCNFGPPKLLLIMVNLHAIQLQYIAGKRCHG